MSEQEDVEEAPLPSQEELADVVRLAKLQIAVEDDIQDLEKLLANKREELRVIREGSLPLALTEMGLQGLPLTGGYGIKMKEVIAASIKKENRTKAHAWLAEHESDDIIKRTITISFGKGDKAWAAKFVKDLERRKKPIPFKQDEAVNHQTLGAYVRGLIRQAREDQKDPSTVIPYDLFGVYIANVTDVERPPTAEDKI